ncbi:HAD family hydrolase [Paenibacillus arenilitoris]|uniref:HAD family hydrolase n=1 Tax=Paenibacillus arenilitoris TaxID=2772299 RepID=UPI00295B5BEB|nr:HAD hydrolase-like protein [Paenibacillus arenilitoris]
MTSYKIKGIIFDMDNTLLRSSIDFGRMRNEIYAYLADHNMLEQDIKLEEHTSSTLIQYAQRRGSWNPQAEADVWDIAAKHELLGMENAGLEPGAKDLLRQLFGRYKMVIVTNNAYSAAITALTRNDIVDCFDLIIGREQMKRMKPAPDAVYPVLRAYPTISPDEWISVGDAWIDGRASQDAGIKFVSYRGDPEKMKSRGVVPAGSIQELGQLLALL